MKNQRILINPFTVKKETSYRVYKLLMLQKRNCVKNNLKFFKFYYFFQFHHFFQFYFKKNIFLRNYCISPIKQDRTYLKINKLFQKKLFVFNFVSFNSTLFVNGLSFLKNVQYFNILFNELRILNFLNKTSYFFQFFYLILFLHLYNIVN